MSAPQTEPLFGRCGDWQSVGDITAANNTQDLTSGTSYLVGVVDTENGGWVEEIVIRANPANNTAATVARIWWNDGQRAVTSITASTDVIADTSHGLENGDSILFPVIGGGAAGLSINTRYYIVSKNANDFKLAATPGGSAIDITSDGTGTTRYRVLSVASGVWPSSIAVNARSAIYKELTIPATTTSATVQQNDFTIPIQRMCPPGTRFYLTLGTAPGGSGEFTASMIATRYTAALTP